MELVASINLDVQDNLRYLLQFTDIDTDNSHSRRIYRPLFEQSVVGEKTPGKVASTETLQSL